METFPDVGTLAGLVVVAVLFMLAAMWILLPFLLISKMGELLKVLREIRGQTATTNVWAERTDAINERIEQNTRRANVPPVV
jgi:hypothetical protein